MYEPEHAYLTLTSQDKDKSRVIDKVILFFDQIPSINLVVEGSNKRNVRAPRFNSTTCAALEKVKVRSCG